MITNEHPIYKYFQYLVSGNFDNINLNQEFEAPENLQQIVSSIFGSKLNLNDKVIYI